MSSEVEDTPKPKKVSLKPIYARSVLASASVGMATPFVGVYAVDLGATPAEMGWLSSITLARASIPR